MTDPERPPPEPVDQILTLLDELDQLLAEVRRLATEMKDQPPDA